MKIINAVWQDIRSGKNLDIYITIIIALTVSILGLIGQVNQAIISSAVLATLALVANSLLTSRRDNEDIRKTLSSIGSDEDLADKFLRREYDRTRLRQILQISHVAFFWGPYLTTHIIILRDIIEKCLQDGLEIHFLLMDPYGTAANLSASIRGDKNTEDIERAIETNLRRLMKLSDSTPPGKLEFRILDYLPSYSIIAFDPHLPSGRIFVRLNSFRIPNETRPTFELTKRQDTNWFNFFVEQFESAWNEAHEYVPI